MKKTIIGLAVISMALLGALFIADKALKAESNGADPEVIKKLDAISKDQQTILQAIDSLKQELYIIKIRVTQQQ